MLISVDFLPKQVLHASNQEDYSRSLIPLPDCSLQYFIEGLILFIQSFTRAVLQSSRVFA